jgi:DNA-directed RNA polymerase specialized sigma24 family protein
MSSATTSDLGKAADPPLVTFVDALHLDDARDPLPERDWVVLVNLIAAGDQRALRQLYERTHRLVFSVIARVTKSRDAADTLSVDVFHEIWRDAPAYDDSSGPVLGWILSVARAKALARFELDESLNGDLLSPTTFLWGAIAKRIVAESGLLPVFTAPQSWTEPDWQEIAPGIARKLLATDDQRERVSMLLRLAAGTEYPAHAHAGIEELHLLHGELWVDECRLEAGDYHRAEPGSLQTRIWSETGCTCVLLTSPRERPS